MNHPAKHPPFWSTWAACAFAGPLVGGALYNWTAIAIPFSYFIGGVASILGAWMFVMWLRAGPVPGPWHGAAFGAFFGAAGALPGAVVMTHLTANTISWGSGLVDRLWLTVILSHSAFAGAVIGAVVVVRWHKEQRLRAEAPKHAALPAS